MKTNLVGQSFIQNIEAIDSEKKAIDDGSTSLSYGALLINARKAARLISSKFGSNERIIIVATLSVDFVVTLLGVIYSGNTPVPIDPDLDEETINYIHGKLRTSNIITPLIENEYKAYEALSAIDTTNSAMILMTSGTSGFPKGVKISHKNLIHSCNVISDYLGYKKNPTAAIVLPMYYSYGLLSQLCSMLFVGGFCRLIADFRNILSFANTINELNLETFCGVPSSYDALVRLNRLKPINLPSVKVICSAGAAMNKEIFDEIKTIFTNAIFFNNYGLTEATPRVSYIKENDVRFFQPTCGKAIEGVEIKIIDPKTFYELQDMQEGMLVIRGPNITSGYYNDKVLTQKSFTPDGYLITGDSAYIDAGYIYLKGRYDDIFNVGGEKIAPLEVERALNKLEYIEGSAVIGLNDEQRGNIAIAFLILNKKVNRKEIIVDLGKHIVARKIPLRYFEVSSLPETNNGKIKRNQLSVSAEYVINEIR